MAIPTDRGHAVEQHNEDGTVTVMVATEIDNGEPVNVFAMHVKMPAVRLHSGVHLVGSGAYRYTDRVVEVSPGTDGAVHVRTPARARGPLRAP